jgi:hypothetical protein
MPGGGYDLASFKAIQMSNRSCKIQRPDGRIDLLARHLWHGRGHGVDARASNDDFGCFEQMVFERAVRRELRGDMDFE